MSNIEFVNKNIADVQETLKERIKENKQKDDGVTQFLKTVPKFHPGETSMVHGSWECHDNGVIFFRINRHGQSVFLKVHEARDLLAYLNHLLSGTER